MSTTLKAISPIGASPSPSGAAGRDRASSQTVASDAPRGTRVHIHGLGKTFGARHVLAGIDLDIVPGEFVAIVGRSGCGKSTLLRLLAGLDSITSGGIELDQAPLRADAVASQGLRLMFQDARLLPWKTVAQNVALGLSGKDVAQRVTHALSAVGLADRQGEWPAALSGGQRQRVALARALIHRPRLLLLDEPLGALDALTRIEMQQLIERLWREHGFTAVLVTHDVSEAVALADRILLIEDQGITLDERVPLPRPRQRGNHAFAALDERILNRVLQKSYPDLSASEALNAVPTDIVRWAI